VRRLTEARTLIILSRKKGGLRSGREDKKASTR